MTSKSSEKTPLFRSDSVIYDNTQTGEPPFERKNQPNSALTPSCWARPCKRHPKRVEVAVFFYFLAFNGSVPLIEQYIRATVQQQQETKLNSILRYWNYLQRISLKYGLDTGSIAPPVDGSQKCPDGDNVTTPFDKQLDESLQSTSSMWLMYIDICSLVPAVFATLIICTLGDSSGRKLGIALPSLGAAIKMAFYLTQIYFQTNMFLVLIGSLVEGISGSQLCLLGSAFAYVADSTTKQQRSLRFIVLATANTLATAATQLMVGYLIDIAGYTTVFWTFGIVHLLNTIYIFSCIPDSKPPTADVTTADVSSTSRGLPRRRSSLQLIKEEVKEASFKIYGAVKIFASKTETNDNRLSMALLLTAFVIQSCVQLGRGAVDTLFLLGYPICFNSVSYGYFSCFSHLLHGFAGLFGVWILTRCLSDITIELVGCFGFTLSRVIFAFATTQLTAYISVVVNIAVNVCLTLLRSMMSKLVRPEKQGALFAVVFSLETLCDVTAGALMNSLYAATVSSYQPMTSLLMVGLYAVNIVILFIYLCVDKRRRRQQQGQLIPRDVSKS